MLLSCYLLLLLIKESDSALGLPMDVLNQTAPVNSSDSETQDLKNYIIDQNAMVGPTFLPLIPESALDGEVLHV
jgi:hypothetical protein